jgi:hypothetical protein
VVLPKKIKIGMSCSLPKSRKQMGTAELQEAQRCGIRECLSIGNYKNKNGMYACGVPFPNIMTSKLKMQ